MWKRRGEKKSQVDVIDRGGDFACARVCMLQGLNEACLHACVYKFMCFETLLAAL